MFSKSCDDPLFNLRNHQMTSTALLIFSMVIKVVGDLGANAPPIGVFPVYGDLPGSIADDYIIDPDFPAETYF